MIAWCRSCREDTITRDKPGARCSWCDHVLIRACRDCGAPIYPKRHAGRPALRCVACRPIRKETTHAHA